MRTKYFQTEGGSEHQRFWDQLGKITENCFSTDDPKDAIFEDSGEMYMVDDSPEIIEKVKNLLDDWGFSR